MVRERNVIHIISAVTSHTPPARDNLQHCGVHVCVCVCVFTTDQDDRSTQVCVKLS